MSGYEMVKTIVGGIIVSIFGALFGFLFKLYLKKPKKEKAEGYFKFSLGCVSSKNTLELEITNIGNTDIRIDYNAGAFINLKDKNGCIHFEDDYHKTSGLLVIPKGTRKKPVELFTGVYEDENKIQEIYKDDNCTLSIYTVNSTEIKLKKFSNKDPLGISKKK